MRTVKGLAGLAIAAGCLYLVFRNVDVAQVGAAFRSFSWIWLAPAMAVYFVDYWLRAKRWQILVAPLRQVPARGLFAVLTIGNAVNNLLPARAGDVTRALLCRQRFGLSRSAALATIFVEKIFDGVATLGLFVLAAWLAPSDLGAVAGGSELVGGMTGAQFWGRVNTVIAISAWLFLAALVACVVAIALRTRTAALLEALAARAPARIGAVLHRIGTMFLQGLAVLRSPSGMVSTVGFTALVWTAEAATYGCIACGMPDAPSPAAILMFVALVNLAVTLPSSPGFWGPFEIAGIGVLKLFGVAGGVAVALTVVTHLVLIVPVIATGLFFMARAHLGFAEVGALGDTSGDENAPAAEAPR